jgi:hypothetical protein
MVWSEMLCNLALAVTLGLLQVARKASGNGSNN